MDDLFDSEFGNILKFLKGIIKGFLYDTVCYTIGWVFFRIVTGGKYPNESLNEGLRDPENSESVPNVAGLVIIAALTYLVFK